MQRYNRIRIILAEQNKRSSWLADELDVTRATVSRWVWNKSQPNIATLYRIAEVLRVDVRELLVPNQVV